MNELFNIGDGCLKGAPPKPLRTYASGGSGAVPPLAVGGRGSGLLSRATERFNTFHSQADLRHRSDNPLFSMSGGLLHPILYPLSTMPKLNN